MQKELTATNYMGINNNYKRHFYDNTKLIDMYKGQIIRREDQLFPLMLPERCDEICAIYCANCLRNIAG
jgi:hypothetical protein